MDWHRFTAWHSAQVAAIAAGTQKPSEGETFISMASGTGLSGCAPAFIALVAWWVSVK